jgi:6-phosphofructokinase 2
MSIVTLTMNPAIDTSVSVPQVVPERKLRCTAARREPGGGGINVARALRALGDDAIAGFPAGGPGGALLQDLLDLEGVRQVAIPVRGWTRENVHVVEQTTGRQYRFCFPGPALGRAEWSRLLDWIAGLRPAPAFLVASGSLPPGVPEDFYARVGALARGLGTRLVLDSSGAALRQGVGPGVHLLKPSLGEFLALLGEREVDAVRLPALATEVVRRGWCELLVLSLGPAGALWASASERQRLSAPPVAVRSSVGAGDSMVAGIVFAMARGQAPGEAVRYGVAAGTAAVMNPGTALCRREDVERLYPEVQATPA